MFLCIWDNGFRGRKPTRNKEHPDRIQIAFDDHRLVNNPGLLFPATLAQRVGLRELVDHHLDLGDAPGRANAGDKMLTLAASALAGGDCIDDADVLRTGGTAGALGCVVNAPSTLGPSSDLGGLRNQVSRLRASRGNNSNVSGRPPGAITPTSAGGLEGKLVAEMPDFRNWSQPRSLGTCREGWESTSALSSGSLR